MLNNSALNKDDDKREVMMDGAIEVGCDDDHDDDDDSDVEDCGGDLDDG